MLFVMIIIVGIIIITLWVLIVGVANIWGIPKPHRLMVVSELSQSSSTFFDAFLGGRLRCPQQFMFDEALWLKQSYRDGFLVDFWFGLVLTGWSSLAREMLPLNGPCFVKSPGTARHIQRSKPQARDCHCFKRWLPGSLFLGSQRSQNLCTVMLAQQISPFYIILLVLWDSRSQRFLDSVI